MFRRKTQQKQQQDTAISIQNGRQLTHSLWCQIQCIITALYHIRTHDSLKCSVIYCRDSLPLKLMTYNDPYYVLLYM